ncbi:MAG: permease [Clostridia bacterium]|nr:permease [Clostridia bacterium]
MDVFTLTLYFLATGCWLLSLARDRQKTKKAMRLAWKSFSNILPDFSVVLALIGIMLTFLAPSMISAVLGQSSGLLGMLLASVVGSITLIPGFVAFPLAKSLLDYGAGVPQIAAFVSTLMMVGFVTAPMEIRFFNKRETIVRNSLSFAFSFLVAAIMGVVIG